MLAGLTAERWSRVKTILGDALEEPPETRSAFVHDSCNGDTTLLREVETLLEQRTDLLENCATERRTNFDGGCDLAGMRLGAYELVREIGRGGMGAVYLAKRVDGVFEKEAAIKLLKRGMDTDDVLRRFGAERRILARLDHPNIARLLDAGATDDGLPYFVMEYVRGEPITTYAGERQLTVSERLQLLRKVCDAVEAAHSRQVIHRDLKPSNILVRSDGEPKLLDFGIAKILGPAEDEILVTMTEQRRLTPLCASPEQTRGEPVTIASDVYALGALLYALLTDTPPHRFSSLQPAADEIARVICEVEPVRPSSAVANSALRRQLRGDLDTIALTALNKEPGRRYASAEALSEDIARYLAGKPIVARKSRTYRLGRLLRRNRKLIAGAAGIALLGLTAGLFLVRFGGKAEKITPAQEILAADNANEATRDSEARQLFLRARSLVYEFGTGAKYQESLATAVRLLQETTRRDSQFALAYSLLSEAHLYLYRAFEHSDAHLRAAKGAAETAVQLAPESGAAHFAQAVYFYDGERDLPRAENEITAALRALPGRVDALELAAKVESRLGRWKDAIEHGEKAIALDPRDPALVPALAQSYTALRRYPDAERVIDRALGNLPPQFAGPLWRGKAGVALAQGNTQAARAALQSSPVNTPAENYLLLQIAVFERNFGEAREIADKITLPAMEPWVLFWRGLIARADGDQAAERDAFLAASKRTEADLQQRPNDADLLSYLALVEAGLGEKEKAIQQARHALEVCPIARDAIDGAKVARIESQVYAWLGQRDVALSKLETLVRIPAALDYGDLALSPAWDGLRDDPRFAPLLEQARRLIDPITNGGDLTVREENAIHPPTKDLVAYDLYLRGKALIDDIATSTDWEGDNRRAIDLIERAVTHDPTFGIAYALLCRLHLNLYGWTDHSSARRAQAEGALQQAIRLAPDAFETHMVEGDFAANNNDWQRALERLRLAERERPNDATVLDRIGVAETRLGLWREAIHDVERAKQLAPKTSNIPNRLKGIYADARDYRNSDRVCDEAIAQFPNGPNYYRAQKVVNSLARGDTKEARARLGQIPEKWDPSGYRSSLVLGITFAERNLEGFKRELANTPWDHFIDEIKIDVDFMRVLVAEQQEDRTIVESILLPRREKLAAQQQQPDRTSNSRDLQGLLADLARVDCYLGHSDDALRESEQMLHTTSDAWHAPANERVRAEVLMRTGDNAGALDILERLAKIPHGPSYGDLLSLRWDRLRGDARFERIVQQLAATAQN